MGICAYETTKLVAIRDARLASLRYIFVVAISLYVVVFAMLEEGGYLSSHQVVGVIRFSLEHPTKNNCDPSDASCINDFAPLDQLPYCRQYDGSAESYAGNVYPCEIYESINSQLVSEKSITVMTRASTTNQSLVCNADDMVCPRTYGDTSSEYKFYIAQSEEFTVLLDHPVTSSKICNERSTHRGKNTDNNTDYACSAESSRFSGRLHSSNAELCAEQHAKGSAFKSYRGLQQIETAPCFIEPNHTDTNQDFFSLSTILQAAGVDIDGCNAGLGGTRSETGDSGSCQTYRDTGATLLLNIFWTDFASYRGLVQPSYYYAPQLIAGSSFKQYVPFYNSYRSQRTLLNAHGIRIAVLLDGEFHVFNTVSFLITMTTAVGLLAVATTIVDLLMLYVLPEKRRYQEAKYERTEEFEGRDIVSSAVAGLNQLVSRDDHERIETTLDGDERSAALDPLLDDNSLSNSAI